MRNRIPIDTYTVLMIAIVPVFLAAAWGLTWNHDRMAKNQMCENAEEYLSDVTDLVPLYMDAGRLQDADTWLKGLEQINPPGIANDLDDVVKNSISYAMNTNPDLETTGTGEVYEHLTPFKQSIDSGRQTLVDKCPETAPVIPDAFPMFFRAGGQ